MLAIIGGSGLTKLPELEITERKIVAHSIRLNQQSYFVRQVGALGHCFPCTTRLQPYHRAA